MTWPAVLSVLALASPDLFSQTAAEGASGKGGSGNSSGLLVAMFALAIVVAGGVIVISLTLWSRKQDDINNMMFFCIGYLFNTMSKPDISKAARALGGSHNPEALLVLIDVVNDKSVDENIRQTAFEALKEMRHSSPRYTKTIEGILSAVESSDENAILGVVKHQFESGDKKYVQSAYLIGRSLLRLEDYEDAREWFRTASTRNHVHPVPMYRERIKAFIEKCNRLLFAQGDKAFHKGDYHKANELYAVAAHGMEHQEARAFATYLRETCVYIKLKEYENAHEALLQALHHQQETDLSLDLSKRVNHLLNPVSVIMRQEEKYKQQEKEIDEQITEFMAGLRKKLQLEIAGE